MSFDELKHRIEKKIESLEEEKTRLRNDLAVVKKALDIAAEFEDRPIVTESQEEKVKRPVGWT